MTSVFAEEGAGGTPWESPVLPHHMTPVLWRPTAAGSGSADLDLGDIDVPLLSPASIRDEAVAHCVEARNLAPKCSAPYTAGFFVGCLSTAGRRCL